MHYPILNVKRDYFDSGKVIVSVENNISDQDNWFIFVTMTTETEHDFTNIPRGYWLKLIPNQYSYIEITLHQNENGWVIVNLQQIGKYKSVLPSILHNQSFISIHTFLFILYIFYILYKNKNITYVYYIMTL